MAERGDSANRLFAQKMMIENPARKLLSLRQMDLHRKPTPDSQPVTLQTILDGTDGDVCTAVNTTAFHHGDHLANVLTGPRDEYVRFNNDEP